MTGKILLYYNSKIHLKNCSSEDTCMPNKTFRDLYLGYIIPIDKHGND